MIYAHVLDRGPAAERSPLTGCSPDDPARRACVEIHRDRGRLSRPGKISPIGWKRVNQTGEARSTEIDGDEDPCLSTLHEQGDVRARLRHKLA
jgi:hypothetical protein